MRATVGQDTDGSVEYQKKKPINLPSAPGPASDEQKALNEAMGDFIDKRQAWQDISAKKDVEEAEKKEAYMHRQKINEQETKLSAANVQELDSHNVIAQDKLYNNLQGDSGLVATEIEKIEKQIEEYERSREALLAKAETNSGSWGFWSPNTNASHLNASSETAFHMAKNSCKISFECMRVDIQRNWLRSELFYDTDLTTVPNEFTFPMYPTAFILAVNVVLDITGETTDIQTAFQQSSASAGGSFGYGPFSISASHSQSDSSASASCDATADGCRLVVKNLHKTIDNKALYETGAAFGALQSAMVAKDVMGLPKGYGFLNYATSVDAENARKALDGSVICDKPVKVDSWLTREEQRAKIKNHEAQQKAQFMTVFVKNIKMTQPEFEALFATYGDIKFARIPQDDKGVNLPYGFVKFATHAEAQNAIDALHDSEHYGQRLIVTRSITNNEREEVRKAVLEERKGSFNNVYVKFLDPATTQEELLKLFSAYGQVHSADLQASSPYSIAFIKYSNHEEAQNAVSALHDSEHCGRKLFVSRLQSREERAQDVSRLRRKYLKSHLPTQLYITRVPYNVTDDALRVAFERFGTVTHASVSRDQSGASKRVGVVSFESPESAAKARVEMSGEAGILISFLKHRNQRDQMSANRPWRPVQLLRV
ncbi:hypothetical protein C0991_008499 [Blastosporella zonata]|nr:hypothetical protein C0991_008499 [Blastosporella zonata]